jgi:cysteinyl-tRNA synthetase
LFDTVRRANAALDVADPHAPGLVAAVGAMCQAFGLELRSGGALPSDVVERAAALDAARSAKDFATADLLRSALQAEGWTVETTREGTTVRR